MCNALFDNEFNGESCLLLQKFPSKAELGEFLIGLIVGESGSSKSVLLKYHFGMPADVVWEPKHSVLSHFSCLEHGMRFLLKFITCVT